MTNLAQRMGLSRYHADEHYRSSLRAFKRRDLRTAIAEIEAAIELLPNHAVYHGVLGICLLEDKKGKQAKEAFERALSLHRNEMLANYGLGMIAYRKKDWRTAEDFFTRALAAQPGRAETQYFLGMVAHRLGQNDEAWRWMDEAGAGFAQTMDNREGHCSAWKREFQKLLAVE